MVPEDGDGFRDFYACTLPYVRRVLAALTEDDRFIDDIAQDALLLALRKWPELRFYDKPEAWVVKVAIRLLRRWQAIDRSRYEPLVHGLVDEPRSTWAATPGETVTEHQDLYEAIRRLPGRQRETIVLHYLCDLPVVDVADLLRIAVGSVKVHLYQGRRRLQELLSGAGDEGGRSR